MRRPRGDAGWALLFLAPNFVGFLAFVAFPVVFAVAMAFTNWDLSLHNRFRDEPVRFIGLQNFVDLLGFHRAEDGSWTPNDRNFWRYLGNTLYLMLGIPLGIAGSLIFALLLTRPLTPRSRRTAWPLAAMSLGVGLVVGGWLWASGYGLIALLFGLLAGAAPAASILAGPTVYRTIFYLPHFTAGVAVFLLWKHMYNPVYGPINQALRPVLDALADLVHATPAPLWGGLGLLLQLAGLVAILWLGFLALRNWAMAESGLGATLLALAGVVVLGLVLLGLGVVTARLPDMAADGLEPPRWLGTVAWAKPALIIMSLWAAVGSNNMLLYIAGLSNVPPELYEAADIDGAGRWQRFWHVTWPQLAPTTFFIVIMSVIGGLQGGFEQARTMTQGGPFGSTTTLAYYVYTEGFETGRLGYGSAIALTMFVMIFTLTAINYRFGNRYVND